MKKQIVSGLLILSLIATTMLLGGCGEPETEPTDTPATTVTTAPSTPETTQAPETTKSKRVKGEKISQTQTDTPQPTKAPTSDKLIACWGDSVTQGYGSKTTTYPVALAKLLGDGYSVFNGGDGGEDSAAIMARMGAVDMKFKNAVTFAAGKDSVVIGTAADTGLITASGENVSLSNLLGNQMRATPLTIGNATYGWSLAGYKDTPQSYPRFSFTSTLTRSDPAKALTLAAGTKVTFASARYASEAYCNILFMGANDKDQSAATLVKKYKTAVRAFKSGRYLVVIPYWDSRDNWTEADDKAFTEAFGDHAVNFRAVGLANANDKFGWLPAQYHLNNNVADVHLNDDGYALLAQALYERGQKLKYWS